MAKVLKFARTLQTRGKELLSSPGFYFERPLVLLQSDDWGRVGIRDQDGFAQLQASGIALGENPYDFYSLESAEDLIALGDILGRHRDSTGRSACLVMNFVLANLDFQETLLDPARQLHLRALLEGLPEKWQRPGLFTAYRRGVADGVFFPALHGLSHFCRSAVEHTLAENGPRSRLLRTLWKAGTPYIFWRMPWVGYEYWNSEPAPKAGFLSAEEQRELIQQAVRAFREFFGTFPVSACAPGYRANGDTHRTWASCGVRVAQNGSGSLRAPHMDNFGILNLYRAVDFEPAVHPDFSLDRCLSAAEECFARGLPAIVSVHAINFHSALKDFRGTTLRALDRFLSALEAGHPDLLYLHDADLLEIVERNMANTGLVSVSPRPARTGSLVAREV